MGRVRKSIYRQPMTPAGIKKIEEGTLNWFDPEMFANFNTGTLEQYLDEKNRREAFDIPAWDWKKIWIAIMIGTLFALINQYVGLKVGMVVAGSWYIIYILGMVWRWNPPTLNVAATASNGAAMICTGFVFTFPAIFILAYDPSEYVGGSPLITHLPMTRILTISILSTMISGILGVMYFIVFRRIWLVEDPLPTPGFEATVKMLDLSRVVSSEASEQARRSFRTTVSWITGTVIFTFFRDFPIVGGKSILDHLFGGPHYAGGDIIFTPEPAKYTVASVSLIPIQFGLGWFMKARTAFLIFLGTMFTWFFVVPLAVASHIPYVYFNTGEIFDVAEMSRFWPLAQQGLLAGTPYEGIPTSPALAAYQLARIMAIGTIFGGGMTALLKMLPVFKTVFADLRKVEAGEGGGARASYLAGKGWYEWPAEHIKIMLTVTLFIVFLVFWAGGFPFLASLVFALLLTGLTFILGAIAVKVMGETGTEPVSATSFLVLIILILTFKLFGMSRSELLIMALIGTTVFGGAISMSGDTILNFKNGLYCGNRPHDLVRGLTPGIIPGAIVSGLSAAFLSYGLAKGELNLPAPQAHAFVVFAKGLVVGAVDWNIFAVGLVVGVLIELAIGMGTAFGLGMYLPLGLQVPMLVGGIWRSAWEKYRLEPLYGHDEKLKTLKLLDTYMMATGLIVGEAIMGTIVALYLVAGLIF
ncbi:MAG: OPT/YSL family transporter, partial [Thermoplasmata archaeon]|nr:OPT/YSL family transporter [Thermoplasmata archaeon]